MKNDGLKLLLYFAYGSLIKGVCGEINNSFVKKVVQYLSGDDSLRDEILEEVYEELPHAIPRLLEMAREGGIGPFGLENVREYVFKVHGCEVMPSCAVISGIVKIVNHEAREITVESSDEESAVRYLSSLEGTFDVGDKVYFHHGWLLPK